MAERSPLALASRHGGDGAAEAPRRLVVELNRRAATDLAWLVESEEVNKTTVVNRALQVYRLLVEAQRNGGSVTLLDPAHGEATLRIIT
ncbi:hypothetical protein [Actinotalea solisilvae]|uniref:hypothetical protein n=1 Tax=Actinotalea solisilvae TaxID=2072922 RepID=UPI0018F24797|nr:hypothetical protein [Actinotalea solisilvae]